MKTYEEFLEFLNEHLKNMSDFIPVSDPDFHSVCFATGRFLLTEPYRWEEKLKNWPVIPKTEKPEEKQLLDFFQVSGLRKSFNKELNENNQEILHKAYELFFPIIISKDEFMISLFRDDLKARRYKKIFRSAGQKIDRVTDFINRHKTNSQFLELMRKFTHDLSGFSLTLINNKKLLDQAIDTIQNKQ